MWANAQRDRRPAEYRWYPLFNTAKFGWCPVLDCHVVTLPRLETRWNLLGCPKLRDRSQPLVGRSSPYYQDMWRRYCCLTSFFPIVNTRCPTKLYDRAQMATSWRFFASCISSEPRAFSTCILNLHQAHTMCGSVADIQSPTAEIRRWKKEQTTGWKYDLPYYIGRP